jgi:hypothetical protein
MDLRGQPGDAGVLRPQIHECPEVAPELDQSVFAGVDMRYGASPKRLPQPRPSSVRPRGLYSQPTQPA